jgi:hypothetical protein
MAPWVSCVRGAARARAVHPPVLTWHVGVDPSAPERTARFPARGVWLLKKKARVGKRGRSRALDARSQYGAIRRPRCTAEVITSRTCAPPIARATAGAGRSSARRSSSDGQRRSSERTDRDTRTLILSTKQTSGICEMPWRPESGRHGISSLSDRGPEAPTCCSGCSGTCSSPRRPTVGRAC